jgi:kumamolisin
LFLIFYSNSRKGIRRARAIALDFVIVGLYSPAPAAKIVVYFTPDTDAGFLDAVTTAIHDTTNRPSILSISWGGT